MTALRIVGTLLWVCLMLQFGSVAVATGEPLFWTIFVACVLAFSAQVYAMRSRDERVAG